MIYSNYFLSETELVQEKLQNVFKGLPGNTTVNPIKMFAGESIVQQGDEVTDIYVLVAGRVSAISNKSKDSIYAFSEFAPITIFAEQEILGGHKHIAAELRAKTNCRLFSISIADYFFWVNQSTNILMVRTRHVVSTLFVQAYQERSTRFLGGTNNVAKYFLNYYEEKALASAAPATIIVKQTHVQMSDTLGCSIRTICRAINQLETDDIISVHLGKVSINKHQYDKLYNLLQN